MPQSWFKIAYSSSPLEQGDVLFKCPTIEMTDNFTVRDIKQSENLPIKLSYRNMIVISQSCDLEDENIDYVQLCPVYPLESLAHLRSSGKRGLLEGDRMVRYAVLGKNGRKGFPDDFLVVDLASVQSIPIEIIKEFAKSSGKRLRLASPYREYLSQKFAYQYMRVGKPTPIRLPRSID
jgi:hypothetical protein